MNKPVTRETAARAAASPAADDRLYGITELAQDCGISLRAIRFYEDKGLLAPRRINGGRAYTRRDRVRLGLILRGKAVGLSLAEIEHILSLYGEHGEGHAKQLDYLVGRIEAAMAELDERRRNIDAMFADLGEVKTALQRTLAAKRRPRKA
ncbi:MAG: MerR family DNA-binding transcriptional regulator [Rhodocyclales bacterium]|jgi:DNA-binding transcriptional MerR regulator|nr:MerR family DNA-binding transcriptional regulator [Rhodocyclales bacterium]